MHNTEVKTENVTGGESTVQALTNGDLHHGSGGVGVASRHHRGSGSVEFSGTSCAGCGKRIVDRFLLKALDMFWHEDCLKCGCCDCRLGEVGSTLYTKANLILCKRDYLRLFGNTGYCAACSKVIPAFEMVMRARANVYHLECFACQVCNHRFCVGDKFYLCENKILCEYDYEERMVFANMAYSPGNLAMLRSNQDTTSKSGMGSISNNNNNSSNSNNNNNNNNNSLPPKLQSLSPSSMVVGHHHNPHHQQHPPSHSHHHGPPPPMAQRS